MSPNIIVGAQLFRSLHVYSRNSAEDSFAIGNASIGTNGHFIIRLNIVSLSVFSLNITASPKRIVLATLVAISPISVCLRGSPFVPCEKSDGILTIKIALRYRVSERNLALLGLVLPLGPVCKTWAMTQDVLGELFGTRLNLSRKYL